jgi:methylglyoxal synthase
MPDAPAPQTIALIAHDNRKPALLEWVEHNRNILAPHDLVGTGTTGRLVQQVLGRPVRCLHSGPLGGDQQLGALISEGAIDLIVFFWDPLQPMPHDPDVKALLRLAVVWNIPMACNRSTADFLISSPLFASASYQREVPDYSSYQDRVVQTRS